MLSRMCVAHQAGLASPAQSSILENLGLSPDAEITSQEAKLLIRGKFEQKTIGPIQKINILQSLTYDDLKSILQRDIKYINEITVSEYQKIMNITNNSQKMYLKSLNHPLVIRPGWEYGQQESDKCANALMYYLVSYDVMMIDVDSNVEDSASYLNNVEKKAKELKLSVRVYKTYAGYHIFITSTKVYRSNEFVKSYSSEFKGDIYYRIFSEKFGFKVRLNKKLGRTDLVSKYLCKYGDMDEDPNILEYLQLHDKLIEHHNESEEPYKFT